MAKLNNQLVFPAPDEPFFWTLKSERKIDPCIFFKQLHHVLPPAALLCLEGSSIAPDVEEILLANRWAEAARIERGTYFPRPKQFHIRATPEIVTELATLSSKHAEPEICDHIIGYEPGRVLLTAYDAFLNNSELCLSSRTTKESVARFAAALGCTKTQTTAS
jgi:hypothetical protein